MRYICVGDDGKQEQLLGKSFYTETNRRFSKNKFSLKSFPKPVEVYKRFAQGGTLNMKLIALSFRHPNYSTRRRHFRKLNN